MPTNDLKNNNRMGEIIDFVTLRKFPYPYQAAATICSDIDDCSRQAFIDIHRILNRELKLPIADSFFGQKSWPWQMAYYENDGETISDDADFIDRAIDDGLIDVLHTWGDFQEAEPDPQKLRSLASRVTDRLTQNSHKIRVWIHHGTYPNYQNISSRIYPECGGDDPHSPYYTMDYMNEIGVRFCWTGELVSFPLSDRFDGREPTIVLRRLLNSFKNVVKTCIGHSDRKRSWLSLKELCTPKTLKDQRTIFSFSRFFYHLDGMDVVASRSAFRHCLSPFVLKQLIDRQGYIVCYTHLAFPRQWDGYKFADMRVLEQLEREGYLKLAIPSEQYGSSYFAKTDLLALQDLAKYYQNGIIWVAPTTQLLTYWMVWRHLKWHFKIENKHIIINIEQLDDPTSGARQPTQDEIAGLCFYTPSPELTTICLGGKDIPTHINPPDITGQTSLSVVLPPPPRTDLLG